MELAAHYENLLASGAVLNVEAQLIHVDPYCLVIINSLNEAECSTFTTSATIVTSSLRIATTTTTSGALIVSIALSLTIGLIITVLIFVLVAFGIMYIRKRKSDKRRENV